jgi:hypothetical protein
MDRLSLFGSFSNKYFQVQQPTHQEQEIEEEQQIFDHRLRDVVHFHDMKFFQQILSNNPEIGLRS